MEQHAKKYFKIQGRKKGPWIGGKSGNPKKLKQGELPKCVCAAQSRIVDCFENRHPLSPPSSMLLHARFFSAALLSVEDVAQSTLTLGGAGGLNSAYMHPPTLETFKEIDTTRPAFSSDPWTLFSTLHLKVSLSVLFHNSALVGTFRDFPNWGRKSFPNRSHH